MLFDFYNLCILVGTGQARRVRQQRGLILPEGSSISRGKRHLRQQRRRPPLPEGRASCGSRDSPFDTRWTYGIPPPQWGMPPRSLCDGATPSMREDALSRSVPPSTTDEGRWAQRPRHGGHAQPGVPALPPPLWNPHIQNSILGLTDPPQRSIP